MEYKDINSQNYKVSIVIRNRNEAHYLKLVMQALHKQSISPSDIIVVDNNSEDNSVDICVSYGARVISINNFSYGRALNLGIKECSGDIIVILSAHSLPMGKHFLKEILEWFVDDKVAAVRCVQIGKKYDMLYWMNPQVLKYPISITEVISKGPLASGCAIRKNIWIEVPFNEEVEAAEDKIWAYEVLKKGYIIISPIPAFYFYMKRLSTFDLIKRAYREHCAVYKSFGSIKNVKLIDIGFLLIKSIFWDGPKAYSKAIISSIYKDFINWIIPLIFRQLRR